MLSMAKQKKTKPNRLTREEWLQKSLDLLISGRHGKLRIDNITKELNVTKGSFYWHFKNRAGGGIGIDRDEKCLAKDRPAAGEQPSDGGGGPGSVERPGTD